MSTNFPFPPYKGDPTGQSLHQEKIMQTEPLKVSGRCDGGTEILVYGFRAISGRLTLSGGLRMPDGPVEITIKSLPEVTPPGPPRPTPPFSAQRKTKDGWETAYTNFQTVDEARMSFANSDVFPDPGGCRDAAAKAVSEPANTPESASLCGEVDPNFLGVRTSARQSRRIQRFRAAAGCHNETPA